MLVLVSSVVGIRAQSGAALSFISDSSNYAYVNDSTFGNFGTSDFSVEAYFKTTSNSTQAIVSKRLVCESGNFWNIVLTAAGNVIFEVDQDINFTNYIELATSNSYNDGNWHLASAIRSGNTIYLYMDGILQGSNNSAGVANIDNAAYLSIGTDACVRYFNGSIDEVRIWGRALADSEIVAHIACEQTNHPNGLLAYYPFNEGIAGMDNKTVTTLYDSSGNGNNGTLYNFTLVGDSSNWIAPGAVATGVSCGVSPTSFTSDSLALVALYDSTGGANWTNSTNWLTTAPLDTWFGVSVSGGRVTSISLSNNNLSKSIPAQFANLSGLQYLNLGNNDLTGPVAGFVGNLTNLVFLNLDANIFLDTIPASIGNLTNLRYLNLDNNDFSGSLPSNIGDLTNLTFLDVSNNSISGSIPTSLATLTNLDTLLLTNNSLSDSLPSAIGNLTVLKYLSISNNKIYGSIPATIANLTSLQYFNACNDSLSGIIPTAIGSLTKLDTLILASNNLSGTIPTSISYLTNLIYLDLDSNSISGSIPGSLGNLTNLQSLQLSSNKLSGSIPVSLGNLVNLSDLELYYNQLTGPIPSSLGSLSKLVNLYLNDNELSGSIPSSLGSLSGLQYVDLGDNELSGAIPSSLGNLSSIINFYAYANQLSGSIPTTFGNLSTIVGVDLSYNKLTGAIPSNIGNLSNLLDMYLNNNQLSGSIPSSLGNLYKMEYLYLNNNGFSGGVPASFSNLTELIQLYLDNDSLTFAGMEAIAQMSISTNTYAPQSEIPITNNGGTLSVSVGGTPTNNTFKWYKDSITNLVATKVGDSTFTPTLSGNYFVVATNSVATQLALYSDTITISNPTITSFTPDSTYADSSVTIHGTGFTAATAVYFADSAASSFTVLNDSVITAVVANGTKSGYIKVVSTIGSDSLGGFVILPVYTWTGAVSSDWNNPNNWNPDSVPSIYGTVIIPSTAITQPVAPNDLTVGDLILGSNCVFTINHSLTIFGSLYFSSDSLPTKNAMHHKPNYGIGKGPGSIKGGPKSNLTIVGDPENLYFYQQGNGNCLYNFTTGANVSLSTPLNIYGAFTPTGGTFNTNGLLTLKSASIDTTAVVGQVGGTILGTVTVERFIPQGYSAYRDLGVCVSGAGTVANTWGDSLDNYKVYSYASPTWVSVNNTDSLQPYMGYKLLVTGRQNPVAPSSSISYMNSNVTLAYSGTLLTGNQSIPLGNGNNVFNFISNPYASQVDFAALTKSGIYDGYWYLDPTKLYDSGYENYLYYGNNTGASNVYASSINQYLQPGQAFFVCSNSSNPSLTFTETAKNNNNTKTAIFGTGSPLNRIAIGLFSGSNNLDGAVTVFNPNFSDSIGSEDGLKINNQGENITFLIAGTDLCANGWKLPSTSDSTDVLPIHLYNLKPSANYSIRLDISQFVDSGFTVYLKDKVTDSFTLLVGDSNIVSFATTSDTSVYSNRYSIVLDANGRTLPVKEINLTATQLTNNKVSIKWSVVDESNLASYKVERSADGLAFIDLATVSPNHNSNYSYTDVSPLGARGYYRIKATDNAGMIAYSNVSSIITYDSRLTPLTIYPNPVTNSSFKIALGNVGKYIISLIDKQGKRVFSTSLEHNTAGALEKINLNKQLAAGSYTLTAIAGDGRVSSTGLIVK